MAGHRDLTINVIVGSETIGWTLPEAALSGLFGDDTDRDLAVKIKESTKEGFRDLVINDVIEPRLTAVMNAIEDLD